MNSNKVVNKTNEKLFLYQFLFTEGRKRSMTRLLHILQNVLYLERICACAEMSNTFNEQSKLKHFEK